MMRVFRAGVVALLMGIGAAAEAQSGSMVFSKDTDLTVRTFILKHLDPENAAALVTPYVDYLAGGGVFRSGAGVNGITVRTRPNIMVRVDSLLKANDKAPISLRLRVQVIAALDTAYTDPAIADIVNELRSVLRFNGYRLVSQGVLSTLAGSEATMSLTSTTSESFHLRLDPRSAEVTERGGSVQLRVSLTGSPWSSGKAGERVGTRIIETGLTVPFGQAVVVGSGSTVVWENSTTPRSAAILVVVRADPVAARP